MAKVAQIRHHRATGLNLQSSPFQTGEGALRKADNCVVDREGIISRRRGLNYYGDKLSSTVESILGEYKDRLQIYDGSGAISYDSDGAGTWVAHSGSFTPPTGSRIRSSEVRSNFYFTTSEGIYKKDVLTAEPILAGVPAALDITLTLVPNTGTAGWFLPDTQVGYRIAFSRKDANDFEIIGAPGEQTTIVNPVTNVTIDWAGGLAFVTHTAHGYSVGTLVTITDASDDVLLYNGTHAVKDVIDANTYTYQVANTPEDDTIDVTAKAGVTATVTLDFRIPDNLQLTANQSDSWEVYRTQMSASQTTVPGDRHFRLTKQPVTSADISFKNRTHTDTLDESFLDIELYTNSTQDTILGANNVPPLADDIALFNGQLHFANTTQEHTLEVQLKSVTGILSGNTLSISDGSSLVVYTADDALEIAPLGQYLVSTGESTTAENINKTARSLVSVINQDLGSAPWQARYISGTNDAPGKILIKAVSATTAQLSITAPLSGVQTSFEPNLTGASTDADAVLSEQESFPNALHYSKFEQPDHVPDSNQDFVGSEEDDILRIVPLRDSLIIFKEEEGIWRKDQNGIISQLDPSVKLLAKESVVVLDNSAIGFTNQGVVRVDENGVSILSRPIESELMKIISFDSFKTTTHAARYESDRKYILWTQASNTDADISVAWVYNYLTEGGVWTKWILPANAGYVLGESDVLFTAHSVYEFILKERKDLAVTDFMEQDLSDSIVTLTTIGTTTTNQFGNTVSTVTLSYTASDEALVPGFLLTQGANLQRIVTVTDNGAGSYTVELDDLNAGYLLGTATLTVAVPAEIEWIEEDAQNPFTSKSWLEAQIYNDNDVSKFNTVCFKTDIVQAQACVDMWDDTTSDAITPLRTFIPNSYCRSRTLSLSYKNIYAREDFEITGMALVFRETGHRITQAPR